MTSSFSSFVQNKFSEYYKENVSLIQPPSSMEKREFGFLLFDGGFMLRHKSFQKPEELRTFLTRITPSNVYYSSAYYERPEAEMKDKGWLGADLVFDIDADHIPTPCEKKHDMWECRNCGLKGEGTVPGKCPRCGEKKFEEKTWPCEVCLESAKTETIKLIDMLTRDFGFTEKEIIVAFSGHRGFHVHVEAENIRRLSQIARKEIVDYIIGLGLETSFYIFEQKSSGRTGVLVGPDLGDLGWKGRIARGTYEFLLEATPQQLKEIGLRKSVVNLIIQHRNIILKSWEKTGPWGIIKGIGVESWRKIAERGVNMQSAKIDTVVTTDIHRLIRLNNTLHGKTGFKKVEVPIAEIESFDPFKSAVAFKKGAVTVFVREAPEFRVQDETYGPFIEEKVELPIAAALLLLCKRVAKVVE